ncbi:uncharacterized protein F5147DRAFT_396233 [Suillus discolor]|uniref:Major facilitator superfamily (MFS) profile domain-containing protein n=1 Tax=Suillus discolor TaxID=1912936 RepID=A0A9P7EYT0_9AGAM|nr:uncharacterized protein F5147DRAFT_396233 [Suillus discolor]KAG2095898.1 hypothetical protein F5147DRAFT_396233 [Suillus discolor]
MAIWLCVVVQLTLKTGLILCSPCMILFIRAAAPNRASLGTTNGIVMVVVAVAKIIGPASAASLFSYSLQAHDVWSIYFFIAIAFLAVSTALLLPRDPSVWGMTVYIMIWCINYVHCKYTTACDFLCQLASLTVT